MHLGSFPQANSRFMWVRLPQDCICERLFLFELLRFGTWDWQLHGRQYTGVFWWTYIAGISYTLENPSPNFNFCMYLILTLFVSYLLPLNACRFKMPNCNHWSEIVGSLDVLQASHHMDTFYWPSLLLPIRHRNIDMVTTWKGAYVMEPMTATPMMHCLLSSII